MSFQVGIRRALLIQVPGSDRVGANFIPLGLLGVGGLLKKHGIQCTVIDFCLETESQLIEKVKAIKPELIGFGGIASSFGSAKVISRLLHKVCQDTVFVAGGPLASTYEILLEDGVVDYVFHGEVEYSLPKFIDFLETGKGLERIGGISFLKEKIKEFNSGTTSPKWFKQNSLVGRSFPEKQLANLDDCGFPDFSLTDLNIYTRDLRVWFEIYEAEINEIDALRPRVDKLLREGKYRFIEMVASRGCTHRCAFCYRHVKGVRRFSADYVIKYIKLIKEHVQVDGVCFDDELFNNDLEWIYDLFDELDNAGLGLSFYMVSGMRADKIDDDLFQRMSRSGVIDIGFGHESGSDRVLKYYGKGVTRQQNIDSIEMARRNGIHPSVQIVIGSPVETTRTIMETSEFLKETNVYNASINYILPLPETRVWKEVVGSGQVKDVRGYLDRVKRFGPTFKVGLNLTNANNRTWLFWRIFLKRTIYVNRYKDNFFRKFYYTSYLFIFVLLMKKIGARLFLIRTHNNIF